MKFGKVALAASAASLAFAPVAMAAERASTPVSGESEIGANASLTAAALFALIVVGAFVAFGGDDEPVSP